MKLFNLFKKKSNFDYKKLHSEIHNNNVSYFFNYIKLNQYLWEFTIFMETNDKSITPIPIKAFQTDDFHYGILCADELIEHLSQSI